jgi:hypothetical protein
MNFIKNICLVFLPCLLLSCSKDSLQPRQNPSIELTFKNADPSSVQKTIVGQLTPANTPAQLEKSMAYDQALVMILDFSVYNETSQYFESEEYKEYTEARDSWQGDLDQWGQWEKLLGDYFRIVADQNLTLESDRAKGMVSGVIGLNYVLVGLVKDGKILHWAEGGVIAAESNVAHAELTWWY